MIKLDGRFDRWAAFTDRELGALLGALEAADREGSIDDVGKALWASVAKECNRCGARRQD